MSDFEFSSLPHPIQKALQDQNYKDPTPIQKKAIPVVLQGKDLLGIAQTGTGKTAAFCLPLLSFMSQIHYKREPKSPRCLILAPTRELAVQIHQSLLAYGKYLPLRHSVIFGGVSQGNQVRELFKGIDVLVATPGRLLDLVNQGRLSLSKVNYFVLDEADRMLDMGFMRDIRRIIPLLPQNRHNLFFSATMPNEIKQLAQTILKDPEKVEVAPPATTVEKVKQSVIHVRSRDEKIDLLLHLLKDPKLYKVLVFVEMKHFANKLADKIQTQGITVGAIHGNKTQAARQKSLNDFISDRVRVLVATDIASRGIDVDGITHVINFELPNVPECYVHRIGRTARAGTEGIAISFCDKSEIPYLRAIEKNSKIKIESVVNPLNPNAPSEGHYETSGTQEVERPQRKNFDKPQRRERSFGGRSQRRDFNRPQRSEGNFEGRPPRRDFDRPQRSEGNFEGRPSRRDFDRPQRQEGNFEGRPSRRDFDRPQRQEGNFEGRPPRRDFDRPQGEGKSFGSRSQMQRRRPKSSSFSNTERPRRFSSDDRPFQGPKTEGRQSFPKSEGSKPNWKNKSSGGFGFKSRRPKSGSGFKPRRSF